MKDSIKKTIDYVQILAGLILATCLITIVGTIINGQEWNANLKLMKIFSLVVAVSFAGIVILREFRWLKPKSTEDPVGWYLVTGILSFICTVFFHKGYSITGLYKIVDHVYLDDLVVWILVATIVISGVKHPRYSIAVVLIACGSTILFFYPFANYFWMLGRLSWFILLAILIRSFTHTSWSKILLGLHDWYIHKKTAKKEVASVEPVKQES